MKSSRTKIKSLTIGKFDGFHLGHQKLFKALSPEFGAILIIDREREKNILPKKYISEFTNLPIFRYLLSEIRDLNCQEFLEKLIKDFPNLAKLVVGYDFQFGKGRECFIFDLKKTKLQVEVIDEVKIDGVSIHSGEIINRLENGDIQSANRFLGRNYTIFGLHISGQGLGGKKLVPTINIKYSNFVSPKNGVYLTKIFLDKKEFFSISFIGVRESTDNKFSLETHIFGNIENRNYGKVKVEFLEFIRENKKFDSLENLKTQIEKDIKIAKSKI